VPFSEQQFFAVFAAYNEAIWPAQIAAYALGLCAAALVTRQDGISGRVISIILAAMWLWTGIAYHWLAFAPINRAAYLFGALFTVQGFVFLRYGLRGTGPRFGFYNHAAAYAGIALIAYAGIFYPLVGFWTGHRYPETPMFGVTPCPVTLFTFGLLLLSRERVPWHVLVIPVLWSLIGGTAAFLLGVVQDWILLLSGLISALLLALRDRNG